jgi:hypothetical protein
MFEVKIILREVIDVLCNTSRDLLWVAVIREVCVINEDLYRDKRAGKEMFPMIKAEDESHEFTIPDVIVVLCLRELLQSCTNHQFLASFISLKQGSA